MKDLPLAARAYVTGVIATGAALIALCLGDATFPEPMLFAVLLGMAVWTSTFKVTLPLSANGSSMSVSYAVDVASLLLLGPHETMAIAGVGAWCQCTVSRTERNPAFRTCFSVACAIITVQAAGVAYAVNGGGRTNYTAMALARPLVALAATYFAVNTATVAAAIALSRGESIVRFWTQNFLWTAPSYFVGALAAAVAAGFTERVGHWVAPLSVAPLYLTYRTYRVYTGRVEDQKRHLQQVSDLHLATIEALARAVDAKDETSQTHIRRVQVYSVALARAIGVASDAELQSVRTAALLHDIGKIAVPEHILSKPGPLTDEEFEKIRTHPTVGAEIVAAVPFPYPVAPLIRSHHERWDGRGYPAGLRGEEIPLGARILAVADSFEALMADRPYHKAMTCEEAAGVLRAEAGKGLDPALVDAFVRLLPNLVAEAAAGEQVSEPQTGLVPAMRSDILPVSPPSARKTVFQDIALAHREIYALYEIAQTMGTTLAVSDTMTLIASKLSHLVPFSTCALFLYDGDRDQLRCRFATGIAADRFRQIDRELDRAALQDLQFGLHSMLMCPLTFRERCIGTLGVFHVEPAFYRDDHRRLLERVCEQAAAVIQNAIVFEQTEEDSLTDALTGLPNTRFLFRHLTSELARAEHQHGEVALMVMDLDRFKDINDNYGHHVGDRALCAVARALEAAIRPYDVCVRYAGDEFIVVLSGIGGEEAERRRMALQQTISDLVFEGRPGKRLDLRISVGMASYPTDGNCYEALLGIADSRMYRDKSRRQGTLRDRAVAGDALLFHAFDDSMFIDAPVLRQRMIS